MLLVQPRRPDEASVRDPGGGWSGGTRVGGGVVPGLLTEWGRDP